MCARFTGTDNELLKSACSLLQELVDSEAEDPTNVAITSSVPLSFTETAPLNGVVAQGAESLLTKGIGDEILISQGKFTGYSIVNKFGENIDIDTASVPEDIWMGGGVYPGFPTGAAETFQAFSSSASDTGMLTVTYLPSFTATAYLTTTVQLNGTTPVSLGVSGVRMHAANYSSGTPTGFNVGLITVRHSVTTANIFCQLPIGRSQTNASAYTVPFGSTAYLKRIFVRINGTTNGTVEGGLWVRPLNGSPRMRRPFSASQADGFLEYPYGGIAIAAGSDIIVRVTVSSANNITVIAGYDMLLVSSS